MKAKCLGSSYSSTQLTPTFCYATVKCQKPRTLELISAVRSECTVSTYQEARQNNI